MLKMILGFNGKLTVEEMWNLFRVETNKTCFVHSNRAAAVVTANTVSCLFQRKTKGELFEYPSNTNVCFGCYLHFLNNVDLFSTYQENNICRLSRHFHYTRMFLYDFS